MNKIKFLSLSLVALLMACFTACENKYDVDHTAHIVGTWTYIGPNYAEALVIKEDGSVLSTGVEDGEYWENVAGTIKIKDNVATMTFEDGDNAIGHIDVVPGIAFSIYEEDGEEWTFNYCAEDLSDEIVGMWVCNDSKVDAQNDMMIETFDANGKTSLTGFLPMGDNPEYVVKDETDYKVVGDLMFLAVPADKVGGDKPKYISERLIYTPKATALGDVMTFTNYSSDENKLVSESWIRVKESLNFTGQTYDYSAAHVTNAKGKDEDFTIMGHTFNMAKMEAGSLDAMFRSILSCLEVNANSIKYTVNYNGQDIVSNDPITIDGNKVTLDMGVGYPGLRKVDMYMFQSANDSQLHIYMPTASAVNYFANLLIPTLAGEGKLDTADTAAVDAVFAAMDARIESINVSLVYKARN